MTERGNSGGATGSVNQVAVVPSTASFGTANIPKLDGKNFQSWRDMIEILLKLKGLDRALKNEDVEETTQLAATLVLLETMDEAHRTRVRGAKSARDIMDKLKQAYADKSAANVYRLLHQYYRYTKPASDAIGEHVGKMSEMRAALKDLGEEQSDKLFQVTLLASLPQEYSDLLELWETIHPDMRTNEYLIGRLLKREETLKDKHSDNQAMIVQSVLIAERKKVTSCNYCGKKGHWRKECRKRLEDEKSRDRRSDGHRADEKLSDEDQANVVFTLGKLGKDLRNHWLADTGASAHMCCQQSWFNKLSLHPSTSYVSVGDGAKVEVKGVGSVPILSRVRGNIIRGTLSNVLFIPTLTANLVSIGAASDQGIATVFTKDGCEFSKGSNTVAKGEKLAGNLYLLDFLAAPSASHGEAYIMNSKRSLNEWHQAFGHASTKRVEEVLADHGLKPSEEEKVGSGCSNCAAGKGRRACHPVSSSPKTNEVGKRVHVDLATFNKAVDYSYYMVCRDEASEFTMVYFLKSKADSTAVLEKLFIDFEYGSGQRIRCIQSDNGSEFRNRSVELLCLREKVVQTFSAPRTPQQNGTVERAIQTITNMARTMVLHLPENENLKIEALKTACYLSNRLPTSRCRTTPFERFTGRKPQIEHLMPFGTPVQIVDSLHRHQKFDCRTEKALLVGYTSRVNTYRVWLLDSQRVIETADIIFSPPNQPNYQENKTGGTQGVAVDYRADTQLNTESMHLNPEEKSRRTKTNPTRRYVTGQDLDEFFEDFRNRDATVPGDGSFETAAETPRGGPRGGNQLSRHQNQETPGTRKSEDPTEVGDPGTLCPDEPPSDFPPPIPPRTSTPRSDYSGGNLTGGEGQSYLAQLASGELEPDNYDEAVGGANKNEWKKAIEEELEAHSTNGTWEIVERPEAGVALSAKWVFKIKRKEDGGIDRFKARLVARGFKQREGVDFQETFAPVARTEALRTLFALAAAEQMKIRLFDVSTAFLNGEIEEEIFMEPPQGVSTPASCCLKLVKALYGLKQAPRAWKSKFDETLAEMNYKPLTADPCVYHNQIDKIIVAVYVDDGIILSKETEAAERLLQQLNKHFKTKAVATRTFLGMEIKQTSEGIELSQRQYIREILIRFQMDQSVSVSSPIIDTRELIKTDADAIDVPYQQAIGSLQYLCTKTRPDLMFAVNFLARFNSAPKLVHWTAVKRVMRYVKGTQNYALRYRYGVEKIEAFSDADWGNDETDRKSISGILILLAGGPIVFASRKQTNIAQSTAEAEFVAAYEVAKDLAWLDQFLQQLDRKPARPKLFVDNQPAVRMIKNHDINRRTKHIDLKYHYIRDKFMSGLFEIEYIPGEKQPADLLTKAINGPRTAALCEVIELKPRATAPQLQQPRARATMRAQEVLKQRATKGAAVNRCGSVVHLAVAILGIIACINLVDSFRLERTEFSQWFPTSNKANVVADQYIFDVVRANPCEILASITDMDSAHGVKKTSYEGAMKECQNRYETEYLPAFYAWASCKPAGKRRPKRFIPITFILGTIAAVAVLSIIENAVSYINPHSSRNRIARIEQANRIRDQEVKRMQEEMSRAHQIRNMSTDLLEELTKQAALNKLGIQQLSKLIPEVASHLYRIYDNIHRDSSAMRNMARSCMKGQVEPEAASQLFSQPQLADRSAGDMVLENVEYTESLLTVQFIVDRAAEDTTIYKLHTFDHWVNYTEAKPKMMRYRGPMHALLNTTANCTKGINEPEGQMILERCDEENYYDPRLSEWTEINKSERQPAAVQVIKGINFKSVYCLYSHIDLPALDKTILCPPYAFKLPLNVAFKVDTHVHNTSTIHVEVREKPGIMGSTHFNSTTTDEDYDREIRLVQKIKALSDERDASNRFSITEDKVTIPLDAPSIVVGLLVLMFVAAIFYIMPGIAQCRFTQPRTEIVGVVHPSPQPSPTPTMILGRANPFASTYGSRRLCHDSGIMYPQNLGPEIIITGPLNRPGSGSRGSVSSVETAA